MAAFTEAFIDEISVTAARSKNRVLQAALALNENHFRRTIPTDFTQVFRGVLGVGIRTNSRGEAVLRLRGSEERQSQVFIDGAPISVPWDGRSDLSLFPASLIRNVTIIKSIAPIEYGANAVLGVVDISTQETGDQQLSVRSEVGSHGAYQIEGEAFIQADKISLQLGANHFARNAVTIADHATIPYDPIDGEGRTNTDLKSKSLFAALALELDWGKFRISAMDINAEKGIAAAAHIDPSEGSPRFWRYPDWHMTQISLAGNLNLNETTRLRVNAWHQRFGQSIVSYGDVSYNQAEDQQDDRDRTWGGRFVLTKEWTHLTTRFVASSQQSSHNQIETDLIAKKAGTFERFRQRLTSIAGEVDIPVGKQMKASFALAHDQASTPLTGGRPAQPPLSKWANSAAMEWSPSTELRIIATLGQRTRFPTMRELYGTSLGQFLLNPDLKPETSLVGDLTFDWTPKKLPITVSITPWFTRINDTLSRRNVIVDGTRLRQRFNLEGSRGYGIEAALNWQVSKALTLETQAFWQHLQADKELSGNRPTLFQRPKSQFLTAANYRFSGGGNLRAEINHTGKAYDEEEDGSIVSLGKSTELNLKFFVPLKQTPLGIWQFYGVMENITDTVTLPQLGLPDPGRTFKIGLRLTGS